LFRSHVATLPCPCSSLRQRLVPVFRASFFEILMTVLRKKPSQPSFTTPVRPPWLLFLKYLDYLEHDKSTEPRWRVGSTLESSMVPSLGYVGTPKGSTASWTTTKAMTAMTADFFNGKLFLICTVFTQRPAACKYP